MMDDLNEEVTEMAPQCIIAEAVACATLSQATLEQSTLYPLFLDILRPFPAPLGPISLYLPCTIYYTPYRFTRLLVVYQDSHLPSSITFPGQIKNPQASSVRSPVT